MATRVCRFLITWPCVSTGWERLSLFQAQFYFSAIWFGVLKFSFPISNFHSLSPGSKNWLGLPKKGINLVNYETGICQTANGYAEKPSEINLMSFHEHFVVFLRRQLCEPIFARANPMIFFRRISELVILRMVFQTPAAIIHIFRG